MKNKILALFLATVMMFSLFCVPAVFAAEETATVSVAASTDSDISDFIGGIVGDDLMDKQDEANKVIETGHNFANSFISFMERIQQLIVKFLEIFLVFVD